MLAFCGVSKILMCGCFGPAGGWMPKLAIMLPTACVIDCIMAAAICCWRSCGFCLRATCTAHVAATSF